MHQLRRLVPTLAALAFFSACAGRTVDEDGDTPGSGGSTTSSPANGGAATGGSATGGVATGGFATGGSATGGARATGGVAMGGLTTGGSATGGAKATGGATVLPTGGATATGGAISTSGGASARGGAYTGGVSASAGTAALVGTGGTLPAGFTKCFDFAASTEGWKKTYAFVSTLSDKTVRDAAASNALLANTNADWMSTAGYGGILGFVQLTIPFATTQIEYQGFYYAYAPATGLALSGRTIHAMVKLVSGMTADDPSKPSGAKLVVKSGADYFYGDGGWVNLSKNEWIELLLSVNTPVLDPSKDASLFDPNDIREIGIDIDTSGAATVIASPGILMLDHICY